MRRPSRSSACAAVRHNVIVDCAHYCHGERLHAGPLTLDQASEIVGDTSIDGFVWIGVVEPDEAELADLQHRFGLNELAVEDAQSFHLRPKIELYEGADVLFAVVRSAQYDDAREEVTFGEVSIFLAPRFVITVRQGQMAELHPARLHLERRPDLLRLGSSAVLWAILDKIVDDYAPVVAGLEQDVDEVEQIVFQGSVAVTERIYRLRGQANDFYRAIHPLLAPLAGLQRGIYPQIASGLRPFFRDINDHLKLVNEEMLGQRDALASVLQRQHGRDLAQADRARRPPERRDEDADDHRHDLPAAVVHHRLLRDELRLADRATSTRSGTSSASGGGTLIASCLILWAYFRRTGMLEHGSG